MNLKLHLSQDRHLRPQKVTTTVYIPFWARIFSSKFSGSKRLLVLESYGESGRVGAGRVCWSGQPQLDPKFPHPSRGDSIQIAGLFGGGPSSDCLTWGSCHLTCPSRPPPCQGTYQPRFDWRVHANSSSLFLHGEREWRRAARVGTVGAAGGLCLLTRGGRKTGRKRW